MNVHIKKFVISPHPYILIMLLSHKIPKRIDNLKTAMEVHIIKIYDKSIWKCNWTLSYQKILLH